jgi:site-specific recombinase XerD
MEVDIMASSDFPAGGREQLVDSFRDYLGGERGLAAGTVDNYAHAAGLFVGQLADPLDDALRGLSAGQVLEIVGVLVRPGGPSVRSLSVGLRALLRFLFLTGKVPRSLVGAVPNEPRWRLASLPARLDGSAVTALLQTCDRDTERGSRDYAILLLLARLGLRAAEVTGLVLEDIDWRNGALLVRGKGGRRDRLPLPGEVGEALAGYLRTRSAAPSCRAVFLTIRGPRRAMSRQGVADRVRRGCAVAGLGQAGPHRLRHTLAGELLAAGASLGEVAQVLRHTDLRVTAVYAKVDRVALGQLARPWPAAQATS